MSLSLYLPVFKMSWLSTIFQSWPMICFLVTALETHWFLCILCIKNVKEAIVIHLSGHLNNAFHFTFMLGTPVIIHLFFPLLLPTCIYPFRLDCLEYSFIHEEAAWFRSNFFVIHFLIYSWIFSKLNDSMMRFYSVLRCILWGKLYAILENQII